MTKDCWNCSKRGQSPCPDAKKCFGTTSDSMSAWENGQSHSPETLKKSEDKKLYLNQLPPPPDPRVAGNVPPNSTPEVKPLDEATQKLWDEWASHYSADELASIPDELKNIIREKFAERAAAEAQGKKAWEELPENEKRAIDQLVTDISKEDSRLTKIESMKGSKIQDVVLDKDGKISKIVLVKDCIAKDLDFPTPPTVLLDGEKIS